VAARPTDELIRVANARTINRSGRKLVSRYSGAPTEDLRLDPLFVLNLTNFKESAMNKAKVVLFAAAFVATGAFAMDDMKPQSMMMDMNAMDTNHDGMISKQEFMKFHEKMWAKMKKNKSGMVDMKDMEMMHAGMLKDGTMMKDKAGK
jgi:uncharacterized membrane protein